MPGCVCVCVCVCVACFSMPSWPLELNSSHDSFCGQAGFNAVAADGSIDPEEVEGLAAQLLGSTLNDAILDIVIDMTDNLAAVDVRTCPLTSPCSRFPSRPNSSFLVMFAHEYETYLNHALSNIPPPYQNNCDHHKYPSCDIPSPLDSHMHSHAHTYTLILTCILSDGMFRAHYGDDSRENDRLGCSQNDSIWYVHPSLAHPLLPPRQAEARV